MNKQLMLLLILIVCIVVGVGLVLFKNYSLSNQLIKDHAAIHGIVVSVIDEATEARSHSNPVHALSLLSRAQGRLKTLFDMYSIDTVTSMTSIDLATLQTNMRGHESELRGIISEMAPDFDMGGDLADYMKPLGHTKSHDSDDEDDDYEYE